MIAHSDNGAPAIQGRIPKAKGKPRGNRNPPVEHRFKPGQSGNPAGRPKNVGASIREWWLLMQHWTLAEIEAVLADQKAPVNKIAAAHVWLAACNDGDELDRILDRTDGRPKQTMDLTSGDEPVKFTLNIGEGQSADAGS